MRIQENPTFLEKVGDRVLKMCIQTLYSALLKGGIYHWVTNIWEDITKRT